MNNVSISSITSLILESLSSISSVLLVTLASVDLLAYLVFHFQNSFIFCFLSCFYLHFQILSNFIHFFQLLYLFYAILASFFLSGLFFYFSFCLSFFYFLKDLSISSLRTCIISIQLFLRSFFFFTSYGFEYSGFVVTGELGSSHDTLPSVHWVHMLQSRHLNFGRLSV